MNWKMFLDYLKFFAGILFGLFAYLTQIKYWELDIAIAGFIILSSGVSFNFAYKKSPKAKKDNKSKTSNNANSKIKSN